MKKTISSIVAAGVMFSGIATQTVNADVKNVGNNSKKAPITKPVHKEKEILVIINGTKLYTKHKPVMKNNRVLVPLQPIANSFSANQKWDNKTKKTTVTYQGKKIGITNGQKAFFVNGKKKSLDVPVQTIDGKVYVPLKVISEGLGGKVNWDAKSSAVSIKFQKKVKENKRIELIMDEFRYSIEYNIVMKDNRILVPIKPVADHLGGELQWDNKTKKTTFIRKDKKIEVTNGKKEFFANGKKKSLDVPVQIIKGNVYVPLKVISEGIGGKVKWDAKSNTARINFRELVKENYYYVDGKGKVGTPITLQQYKARMEQGIAQGKELVSTFGVKNLIDGTISYDIDRKGIYTFKGQKIEINLIVNGVTDTQGKGFSEGMYDLRARKIYNTESERMFYIADQGVLEGFNSLSEALDYSAIDAFEKMGYTIDQN
ncbi:copper amine oxidase N-terminal domain-containing protein [Bacillus thuringiensis]|uniref:copper amine oxidase N-terminal domain-containing protein n=1 Tax=Bacillus thuringiensis TaxID=1428 RepID=UPI0021D64DE1|nr:copper amine oxidase N-terminal domain-containing protein [Bacillus thuringiensis]MCU7667794.1 copper amine oxidase N-terminal domain-containing protein [Bacillus thuringiensis]